MVTQREQPFPVFVAGGGIAAAMPLTRRGFDVTVLEQAAQLAA